MQRGTRQPGTSQRGTNQPGTRHRSFWGWGHDDQALDAGERANLAERLAPLVGTGLTSAAPPDIADIELPLIRVTIPDVLAHSFDTDPAIRAGHCYGKSFRDVVRGLAGDFAAAPDAVAFPTTEGEVASLLDWAESEGVIMAPYGGGSSVTGGVEVPIDERDGRPFVSLDLSRLSGVLEIDHASRAARILAGTYGPELEDALRPEGLTLRHYPQSFEFSSLGGWLATRSGGHFATLHTHIDDFVESIRAVTPAGVWESRRLPGSGAGPSPDRLLLGSEGIFGVITEAWMRLQDRPEHRSSFVAKFPSFSSACDAARTLAQSGLWPQNCRVLDEVEALISGAGDGTAALLLVGFESAHISVDAEATEARELVGDAGGAVQPSTRSAETWRSSFLRAPYIRDALVQFGLVNETFETAMTWDHLDDFVRSVRDATNAALISAGCGPTPLVSCRLTHVYPDGAAPYFTITAPGRPGTERLAQWAEVKAAAMDTIANLGGTVTHHHAVGRDHRPGYDRQVPPPFQSVLRAAKSALDPSWILNPGVLVDRPAGDAFP